MTTADEKQDVVEALLQAVIDVCVIELDDLALMQRIMERAYAYARAKDELADL